MRLDTMLTRPALVAPGVEARELQPLGKRLYTRVNGLLTPAAAAAVLRELAHGVAFERENILGWTRVWRASIDARGALVPRAGWGELPALAALCGLLTHAWFEELLAGLTGERLQLADRAKFMRMGLGDRIFVHEDNHDARLRYGVVFYFSPAWQRSDGGQLLLGQVARRESQGRHPDFPLELIRRHLSRARVLLTPRFNSLCVFPLTGDVAHGVTPVRVRRWRHALVALYGRPDDATRQSLAVTPLGYSFPRRLRALPGRTAASAATQGAHVGASERSRTEARGRRRWQRPRVKPMGGPRGAC